MISYSCATNSNAWKFAKECAVCRKANRNQIIDYENGEQEVAEHLLEHLAIPEYACRQCELFFVSVSSAKEHFSHHHGGVSGITTVVEYFAGTPKSVISWRKAIIPVKEQLNLHINNLPLRVEKKIHTQEDMHIESILRVQEQNLTTLNDYRNHYLTMFLSFGDWSKIGNVIRTSPSNEVRDCFSHIREHLQVLLTNDKAINSLSTLFLRLDGDCIAELCSLLQVESSRDLILKSSPASHFFAKLCSAPTFPDEHYHALTDVLTSEECLQSLDNSPDIRGNVYYSIACRPGAGSSKLIQHILQSVSTLICFKFLVNCVFVLNRTNLNLFVWMSTFRRQFGNSFTLHLRLLRTNLRVHFTSIF